MGLPVAAALCTLVLEGRCGHAAIYRRVGFPRSASWIADWSGPSGAAQGRCFAGDAAAPVVAVWEFLAMAGAVAARGVHRDVSVHAAAGADRVGLLCLAGASWRANPRGGRGRADIVILHRRVLCRDISRRYRFD